MWDSVNLKTIALKSMLRVTVKILTAKTANAQNVTKDSADMKTNVHTSAEKSASLSTILPTALH